MRRIQRHIQRRVVSIASQSKMAAYGPEDFVFGDYDFDDFSDFSEVSDDEMQFDATSDTEGEDDSRVFCRCKGLATREMIACDNKNCTFEWFHYSCVGLTADSIPDGSWFCDNCKPSSSSSIVADKGDYCFMEFIIELIFKVHG